MTREKNTTHRSRRSSINQSINHSLARRSRTFSSSGAYVKSPVIADTASDVGNVLRTASRRQSPLGIEPRINESHRARITDRIASHRIAPRNDVHQTRAIARASDGVGKPSHRSNARGRRVHAHDPRARRHVDDALFFFFLSLFSVPSRSTRCRAMDVSRHRASSIHLSRTRRRVE